MSDKKKHELIVIGASAGGLKALISIFSTLPADFSLPIVVVQHRSKDAEKKLLEHIIQNHCKMKVKQADEKEKGSCRLRNHIKDLQGGNR